MNDKIRAQMNSMINNTTTRSYLQDTVITMADDGRTPQNHAREGFD